MSFSSQPLHDSNQMALRFAGQDGLSHFDQHIREQRTAYFPESFTQAETNALLNPAVLGELLQKSATLADSTEVFTGHHLVRLTDMLHRSERNDVDVVTQQLAAGATVRFRNLERQTSVLRSLGYSMAQKFGGTTTINAYLTPGGQKGFPPHFDNTDVFILQLLGSKDWTLFDNYTNRQELPLRSQPWDPEKYRPVDNGNSFTVEAGGIVYIPRGYMHAATCIADISLHLTISLDPTTVFDCMTSLLEEWAIQNSKSRRRLSRDHKTIMSDLQQHAEDFSSWLTQLEQENEQSTSVETSDGARRFTEAIEAMRTSPAGHRA